ncbi:MAG: trypsin-like peptidase domain-containing protein [Actinomycetota bacterium]|nr:trypsin-like peptidase domain-containing protein [Actinomycetota bacterium]
MADPAERSVPPAVDPPQHPGNQPTQVFEWPRQAAAGQAPPPGQTAGGMSPPGLWQSPATAAGGSSPWGGADAWGAAGPKQRRGLGRLLLTTLAVAAIALSSTIGGVVGHELAESDEQTNVLDRDANLGGTVREESVARPAASIAGIAARVLPTVVSLEVRRGTSGGSGSGVIIRSDGYILTNNHVISAAADGGTITLRFNDERTSEATIVGRDSTSDLAVIKADTAGALPAATLGSSRQLQVGDPVIAVGSPLGLSGTVTAGIVSSKNRPVSTGGEGTDTNAVINAIQTDAAVNPGNSGGPLVDGRGAVVGINSAIATLGGGLGGTGGSIGLGFAIPIDSARRIAEQIIRTGKATRPVIGACLDPNYEGEPAGARISSGAGCRAALTPQGPAAKAGLKEGDVITAIDDDRVFAGNELIVAIRDRRPGDRVKLTYVRNGSKRTVTVTLAESG